MIRIKYDGTTHGIVHAGFCGLLTKYYLSNVVQ